MNTPHELSAAARDYATAYASHYADKHLADALRSYESIIAQHPKAPEADYSRAQIRNIVKQVVPADEVLASELGMAQHHLQATADAAAAVASRED